MLHHSIPKGIADFDGMGVQCLCWSQGRHNSTMSLPNQIYRTASSSSTMNLRSQLAAKRTWKVDKKRTKDLSWEAPTKPNDGQLEVVEERWRQFFSDPSMWWDHRSGKTSTKFPDFKHKETQEALWVLDRLNPDWVAAQLATVAPGILQQPLSTWNRAIETSLKDKNDKRALDIFDNMQRDGVQADKFTLTAMLKACGKTRALNKGKEIHKLLVQNGLEVDPLVGTSLFDMYVKCGRIEDAHKAFRNIPRKDVFLWTSLIQAYGRNGQGRQALELYREMESANVPPIPKTYVAILTACASLGALEEGKRVHSQIIQNGCQRDFFVGNSLIDMYTKSGNIDDAQKVFDSMHIRNGTAWNAMIGAYVKGGQAQKALELFKQMQLEGIGIIPATFMLVLRACASRGALDEGRNVHAHVIKSGCESNVFVARGLVDMYSKCGSVEDAERVFGTMPEWNVISWTAMIGGYVKCGQGHRALQLYQQMLDRNVAPAPSTFVGVLTACASIGALEEGRAIHAQVIERGCEADMFVRTSLIDMYSKCGCITEARAVFRKMRTRNVVSWSAMILAHVKCGEGWKALKLYQKMLREGLKPFPATFLAVLNACAIVGSLEEGRKVHRQIIQSGCESDLFVGSSLIDMYAKCGSLSDAKGMFKKMKTHCVVPWNAMISGYVKSGQAQGALELYEQMEEQGVEPVSATFVAVLSACGGDEALDTGRRIHAQAVLKGFESDVFIGSSLIEFYSKHGCIEDARAVFDVLNTKNIFCWNNIVSAYVKCGDGEEALELYKRMEAEGVEVNHLSFVAGLNACGSLAALEEGRRVHKQIVLFGCQSDGFVASTLVDVYSKCRSMEEAEKVFELIQEPSLGTWNAMICGHLNCDNALKALQAYRRMPADAEPLPSTFVAVLKACGELGALGHGRRIHAHLVEAGAVGGSGGEGQGESKIEGKIEGEGKVEGNGKAEGNSKGEGNGKGEGYGKGEGIGKGEGLGLGPDLGVGEGVGESDPDVGHALLDMYAKCGSMDEARKLFTEKWARRDLRCWNSMLEGYAMHGHAQEALQLYETMCNEDVEINDRTFLWLLTTCREGGLVQEGLHYIRSMTSDHGVLPGKEHHACLADLLGRAGRLREAEDIVIGMAAEADAAIWLALLEACRVHGNFEIGARIAERIVAIGGLGSAAGYDVLANFYVAAGEWERRERVNQLRIERDDGMAPERPECTFIEINDEVHAFTVDQVDHPQIEEIQSELRRLSRSMTGAKGSFVSAGRFVLDDKEKDEEEEEEEEDSVSPLSHHTDMLAIALGLISTSPGTPVRIVKNLDVSGDCHSANKLISRISGKTIIARYAGRFHRFKNGLCSCRDCW